jgi:D-alanyl-D-alanine dipeptidase
MIERDQALVLSWAEADDPNILAQARERARARGVQLVIGTGARPQDVVLSKREASDHQTYKAAAARAAQQNGVVVVI